MKRIILILLVFTISSGVFAQIRKGVFTRYSYKTKTDTTWSKLSSKYAINSVIYDSPESKNITILTSKKLVYTYTSPAIVGRLPEGNLLYYNYSCKDAEGVSLNVYFVFNPDGIKVNHVIVMYDNLMDLYEL